MRVRMCILRPERTLISAARAGGHLCYWVWIGELNGSHISWKSQSNPPEEPAARSGEGRDVKLRPAVRKCSSRFGLFVFFPLLARSLTLRKILPTVRSLVYAKLLIFRARQAPNSSWNGSRSCLRQKTSKSPHCLRNYKMYHYAYICSGIQVILRHDSLWGKKQKDYSQQTVFLKKSHLRASSLDRYNTLSAACPARQTMTSVYQTLNQPGSSGTASPEAKREQTFKCLQNI